MAYNPGYPPTAPPTGPAPDYDAMDRDYINLPPGSKGPGYPPYPPNQGDMPMAPMGFAQPQAPPGYAYPPVPVPIQAQPESAPITAQPMAGGYYPPPPYTDGYPSPQPPYNGGQPPNVGYAPQPVMAQPMQAGAGYGTPGQHVPLNVPQGLEYLTQLDRLLVKQKVELLEAFLGCETKNKYKVRDSQGRELYTAKEDTDCCTRNCCGTIRPFDIKIKDMSEREVIHLSRPLACQSCCFPCCMQSIQVFAPPGQLAGTVEQEWSLCTPQFSVKDAQGEVVLRIEGPLCTYSICGNVEFQILSRDGATQVGKISKQWSGLVREAFTDADNFGISFPIDLDVRMKAVMLGACFLIDFMFFEKANNQENDGVGML